MKGGVLMCNTLGLTATDCHFATVGLPTLLAKRCSSGTWPLRCLIETSTNYFRRSRMSLIFVSQLIAGLANRAVSLMLSLLMSRVPPRRWRNSAIGKYAGGCCGLITAPKTTLHGVDDKSRIRAVSTKAALDRERVAG